MFKIYYEREPPNEGGCLRYMMNRNRHCMTHIAAASTTATRYPKQSASGTVSSSLISVDAYLILFDSESENW